MKKVYVAIFACLLFAFSSGVASSEIVDSTTTPTQSSTESAIKIERVWTESQQAAVTHPLNSTGKEDIKATATIGDAIYIYLNNTEATQRFLKTPKNRIMLYLNDSPLATVHPETIDSISCWLKFQLARNDSNQNAWAIILGSPNLRKLGTSLFVPYFDSVRVSIGKEGAFPETSYGKLPLTRMFLGGAWIFFLLFVAAVPLGCWATYKYKLLRVPRSQITMEAVDESNIFDPDKYSYPEDELVSEKIKIVSNSGDGLVSEKIKIVPKTFLRITWGYKIDTPNKPNNKPNNEPNNKPNNEPNNKLNNEPNNKPNNKPNSAPVPEVKLTSLKLGDKTQAEEARVYEILYQQKNYPETDSRKVKIRRLKTETPYSLALCQMGFWLLLVHTSYVFVWAMVGIAPNLSETILTILGISSFTALTGNIMDRNSTIPVKSTQGFIKDILSDHQRQTSFHRFQTIVWTGTLGVVFLFNTYQNLSIMNFSPSLLILMGISNSTYLGFKYVENK